MYLNSTVRLSTAGLGRGFPIGLQQLNFYPRISAADKGDRVELKHSRSLVCTVYDAGNSRWTLPLIMWLMGGYGIRSLWYTVMRVRCLWAIFQSRFQSRYRENQIWGRGVDKSNQRPKVEKGGVCWTSASYRYTTYCSVYTSQHLYNLLSNRRQSVCSKMAVSVRSQDVREKVIKEGMLRHRQSGLYSRVSHSDWRADNILIAARWYCGGGLQLIWDTGAKRKTKPPV